MRGVYPFWFWNDALEEDELSRQIDAMADAGVRGFFIHPRQGLDVPYMSSRFLELIAFACDRSSAKGIECSLYDEYPYPSGIAGGAVAWENPAFLATRLRQGSAVIENKNVRYTECEAVNSVEVDLDLDLGEGSLLSAVACPLDPDGTPDFSAVTDMRSQVGIHLGRQSFNRAGLTSYNRKRFFASVPHQRLAASLPTGRWGIYWTVQELVRDHKYWLSYIDPLNTAAVRSFLAHTHEKYFAALGSRLGKTIRAIFSDEIEAGWSPLILPAFRADHGYDCEGELWILEQPGHPSYLDLKERLGETKARLFAESFERQVAAWCSSHGLLWCGERPVPVLSELEVMDVPGCEPGHTKAGSLPDVFGSSIRGNARAVYSAALVWDKKASLCECLHSLGWGATLLDEKLVFETLALAGITVFVPHGYFYSTHGLRRHDAPPSFFYQMPYWEKTRILYDRLGKILEAFEGTVIDHAAIILEPSEGIADNACRLLYREIQHELLARHIDFVIADSRMLLDSVYFKHSPSVLIVPEAPRWNVKAREAIEKCKCDGWFVYQAKTAADAVVFVLAHADRAFSPKITGETADRVWTVIRKPKENGSENKNEILSFCFAVNLSSTEAFISVPSALLREINISGTSMPQENFTKLSQVKRLGPFESALLEIHPQEKSTVMQEVIEAKYTEIKLDGKMELHTLDLNCLRLGFWTVAVIDPVTHSVVFAGKKVEATPLENILSSSACSFPVSFVTGFGRPCEIVPGTVDIEYQTSFNIESVPAGPVYLVMERDTIRSVRHASVIVNGIILSPESFEQSSCHIAGSLGYDVSALLHEGENSFSVLLADVRPEGGLVNPLWLYGSFSVFLDSGSAVLRPPVSEAVFMDFAGAGLPYYSGKIDWKMEQLQNIKPGHFRLEPPAPFRDACQINVDGYLPVELPWPPYEWTAVPLGELTEGEPEPSPKKPGMTIRVWTSLSRCLEGEYFDEISHAYRSVEP